MGNDIGFVDFCFNTLNFYLLSVWTFNSGNSGSGNVPLLSDHCNQELIKLSLIENNAKNADFPSRKKDVKHQSHKA